MLSVPGDTFSFFQVQGLSAAALPWSAHTHIRRRSGFCCLPAPPSPQAAARWGPARDERPEGRRRYQCHLPSSHIFWFICLLCFSASLVGRERELSELCGMAFFQMHLWYWGRMEVKRQLRTLQGCPTHGPGWLWMQPNTKSWIHLRPFFCLVFISVYVLNAWPKTNLLLPMWPRDGKRLHTPGRVTSPEGQGTISLFPRRETWLTTWLLS